MARAQQPAAHEGSLIHSLPVVLFLLMLTHVLQYDRVDPAELQSLKDEVESLRAEKSTWEAQQTTQTQQSTEHQERVNSASAPVSHKAEANEDCIDCRSREND
jgi:hypothetical protein